jgi:ribonuclease BN (tRNA processing enzyme)
MIKLKFLGVGSAFFGYSLGETAAIIYEDKPENGFYLIDCGVTALHTMQRMNILNYCQGVFLTHLHSDHIGGLELMGFWWYFIKKERLPLYIRQEILEDLEKILDPTMKNVQDEKGKGKIATFRDYFKPFSCNCDIVLDNKVRMSFREVKHVPDKQCFGLDIVVGDKKHVYSGDTSAMMQEANDDREGYVWHDCQLFDSGKANVHCYIGDLKGMVEDLSFNKINTNLFLMHYGKKPNEQEEASVKRWCGGFVEVGQEFNLEGDPFMKKGILI